MPYTNGTYGQRNDEYMIEDQRFAAKRPDVLVFESDVLEKNINETLNPPGNFVQTVGEASFDAWIKYYRQNENSPNAQVNYYVKGSVLAMILDILIKQVLGFIFLIIYI